MRKILIYLIALSFTARLSDAQNIEKSDFEVFPFGERGNIKMTYDARQRPNSVFLDGKVYLAFNSGAAEGATGKSKTKPMVEKKLLSSRSRSRKISETKGILSVHPNPATETLNVYCDGNSQNHFVIYDLSGQIMSRGTAFSNPARISIKHLKSGIYLLKAQGEFGIDFVKFIKSN